MMCRRGTAVSSSELSARGVINYLSDPYCLRRHETTAFREKAAYSGGNGDGSSTSIKVGGVESVSIAPPAAGDDVCYEGGCPTKGEETGVAPRV